MKINKCQPPWVYYFYPCSKLYFLIKMFSGEINDFGQKQTKVFFFFLNKKH